MQTVFESTAHVVGTVSQTVVMLDMGSDYSFNRYHVFNRFVCNGKSLDMANISYRHDGTAIEDFTRRCESLNVRN